MDALQALVDRWGINSVTDWLNGLRPDRDEANVNGQEEAAALCIESTQARVSVRTFLQFMKEVAEIGEPWRPIRDETRFAEHPAQAQMFRLLCSLAELSGDAQWATYSVQHWLRAGAWYLALVSLILIVKLPKKNSTCVITG